MQDGVVERVRFSLDGSGDRDQLVTDLDGINGVRNVNVAPDEKSVDVAFDSTVVDANALREAIEGAGYDVTSESAGLPKGNTEGKLW